MDIGSENCLSFKAVDKKTILHISHTDIRIDSRILKELTAHHSTGSYDVHAIGVSSTDEHPPSTVHADIEIDNLNIISSKSKWRPAALRHLLTLIELTFRMTRKAIKVSPDVIHCHDTLVLPIGYLVKLFTGCKLVYDAHELESNKNGQSKFMAWGTLLIEKFCWSRIDLLVSVSPSILTWYDDNLGKKESVLVLNSPIVENIQAEEDSSEKKGRYFHEKFNIPEDKLVFIYLGILGSGRGLELVLDSFSNENIDSHVVFMGFGELAGTIKGYDDRHSNIHLHSAVQHKDVVRLTRSADVGLCYVENISLSDYYCLPNKLFEYAFSGIPILASGFPDLTDYVEKFSLGKCSDVNAESISNAIQQFEKEPHNQLKSDLAELSWDSQSTRLVAAYQNMFA